MFMYTRQNSRVLEILMMNVIVLSGYSPKSQCHSASVRPSDVRTRPQAVGPPEPSSPRQGQAGPHVRTSSGRFPRAHGSA